jgi:hypothetical protein
LSWAATTLFTGAIQSQMFGHPVNTAALLISSAPTPHSTVRWPTGCGAASVRGPADLSMQGPDSVAHSPPS